MDVRRLVTARTGGSVAPTLVAGVVAGVVAVAAVVVVGVVASTRVIDAGDDRPARGPVLRCSRELAAFCAPVAGVAGLRTQVVDDGLTLASDAGLDAPTWWLTVDPLPEVAAVLAAGARPAAPPPFPRRVAIASTPLGVGAEPMRATLLRTACGPALDALWACVRDLAGRSWGSLGGDPAWGPVRVAIDDPTRSGVGLLALAAHLSGGAAGAPAFDPAGPAVGAALDRLLAGPSITTGALEALVARPPTAEIAAGLAATAPDEPFALVFAPDPTLSVVVTLAIGADHGAGEGADTGAHDGADAPTSAETATVAAALRARFLDAGWATSPDGERTSGFPSAPALAALLTRIGGR